MLPLGKVAVITGGTNGIGARMAGVFRRRWPKVVIAGRPQFPNRRVTRNPEVSRREGDLSFRIWMTLSEMPTSHQINHATGSAYYLLTALIA
ncbi:MAG: hypothetical protein JO097_17445 [Acidobacteriaceae bacterium]|nr:hypothetical protein [Acidobacteriaceae bacterium]